LEKSIVTPRNAEWARPLRALALAMWSAHSGRMQTLLRSHATSSPYTLQWAGVCFHQNRHFLWGDLDPGPPKYTVQLNGISYNGISISSVVFAELTGVTKRTDTQTEHGSEALPRDGLW